jgi:predicted ATPase
MTKIIEINPNADKDFIDEVDLNSKHFPQFLQKIELSPFRHIPNLALNFIHPISVIAGTNRSGKSTILMALACSHYNFKRRNVDNGLFARKTWSEIMQFTSQDRQREDWTYYITYRIGDKIDKKKGQRKAVTRKWNGIGKAESQFKNREVFFLDLDRISPARSFSKVIFRKSKKASITNISQSNIKRIEQCLSYVLEETFALNKIASHQDKDIFKYSNSNEYSSYNAATGEEALIKIIIDIVEAEKKSLILIDEIEAGLHPKIQRRLIEVLYSIAKHDKKQFILTSHSPSILSSLPEKARIFIEKNNNSFRAIPNISVSAALSKMDSKSYPLVDLYCEDNVAKKIILKAISSIQSSRQNFHNLINIIVSGSADKTYRHFKSHQETYPKKEVRSGFACILDGDCRIKKCNSPSYPPEECLHFLYSDFNPEKFLLIEYLKKNPNTRLDYHLNNSDNHCLLDKMIENSMATTRDEAFEILWDCFVKTNDGASYFEELKLFIIKMAKKYSPDL